MPRTARAADGGIVHHVLNRGNGRMNICREPGALYVFVDLLIAARLSPQYTINPRGRPAKQEEK